MALTPLGVASQFGDRLGDPFDSLCEISLGVVPFGYVLPRHASLFRCVVCVFRGADVRHWTFSLLFAVAVNALRRRRRGLDSRRRAAVPHSLYRLTPTFPNSGAARYTNATCVTERDKSGSASQETG